MNNVLIILVSWATKWKFPVRKNTIFSNVWYKSGTDLKNGVNITNRAITPQCSTKYGYARYGYAKFSVSLIRIRIGLRKKFDQRIPAYKIFFFQKILKLICYLHPKPDLLWISKICIQLRDRKIMSSFAFRWPYWPLTSYLLY